MSDRPSIREIVISCQYETTAAAPAINEEELIPLLEAREADEQSEVISYVVAKIKELTLERDAARSALDGCRHHRDLILEKLTEAQWSLIP